MLGLAGKPSTEEETTQRLIRLMMFWVVLGLPLFASDLQFVSFDIPEAKLTRPFGVNARGQIVGLYRDSQNAGHGFLVDAGDLPVATYTQIDVPGATFTNASSINARGDIVGRWTDSDGYNHGYLRTSDGQVIPFDPAAPCVVTKVQTVPHGINDVGDIVGRCFDMNDKELGFLWRKDGTFRILDYPGSLTTDAWMLSNGEEIVGDYSDTSGVVHGYFWTDAGGFVSFDFPGAHDTGVRAINERGDIAGVYDTFDGSPMHGFLLLKRDQSSITVDYPGSINNGGTLVTNDSGLIVGGYVDLYGEHGFVAAECPPSGCR